MPTQNLSSLIRLSLLASALVTSGCSVADRLKTVGEAPGLSAVEQPPATQRYRSIAMPMPSNESVKHQSNSLWRTGARAFFKDQRAAQVGDILTVNIDIDEKAELDNTTTRARANAEDAGLPGFFGAEAALISALPSGASATNLVDMDSTSSSTGTGSAHREEKIELTVAAYITQVLPNGNLVIQGSQEIRVNYEVRQLSVTGIVRPEDISNSNMIKHTQIAEARISYGGRGHLTDVQQPRYGQQVYDILMPW